MIHDWPYYPLSAVAYAAGLLTRPLLLSWRRGRVRRHAWRHRVRTAVAQTISPVPLHPYLGDVTGLHYRRTENSDA